MSLRIGYKVILITDEITNFREGEPAVILRTLSDIGSNYPYLIGRLEDYTINEWVGETDIRHALNYTDHLTIPPSI